MPVAAVVRCRAAEIFADPRSAALFEENERETANPLLGPVTPDREMYAALEGTGLTLCFAAREGGVLCGYAFLVMSVAPHYGKKFATVASLFVREAARRGGLGAALMRTAEEEAKAAGCEEIFYTARVGSRLARLLFLQEDRYALTNHVFTKRLR